MPPSLTEIVQSPGPVPKLSPKQIQAIKDELIKRGELPPPPPVLTKGQQAEWDKCKESVLYFIQRWGWTYDPMLRYGEFYIRFRPFPFQESFLKWLEEHHKAQKDGMVEKSRDCGATYLAIYYLLHQWLFVPGFSAGIVSNKLDNVDSFGDTKSIFEKFRIVLRRLPPWMMPAGFAMKKHAGLAKLINPQNKATIIGEGGDQAGHGGRASIYVIDEAARLDHPEMVDAGLYQATQCRIYISTPCGRNSFYKKRERMDRFRMHWIEDPRKNRWEIRNEYGELTDTGVGPHPLYPTPDTDYPYTRIGLGKFSYPWYEEQLARESKAIVSEQIDISYLGSGNPVFDIKYLSALYEELLARNFSHRVFFEEEALSEWGGDVSTYKDPIQSRQYLLVADVAEGLNEEGDHDWSVAHVYDLSTWEQVCHYRGRPDTHIYGEDLANLATIYNNALVAVERNGPGLSVLNTLMNDCKYHHIYYHQDFDDNGMALTSLRPGWPATVRSVKESLNDLDSIISDMAKGELGIIWNHPHTVDELMSFVKKPGRKTGADSGAWDDEVSASRVAAQLLPMFTQRRPLSGQRPPKQFTPKVSNSSKLIHI